MGTKGKPGFLGGLDSGFERLPILIPVVWVVLATGLVCFVDVSWENIHWVGLGTLVSIIVVPMVGIFGGVVALSYRLAHPSRKANAALQRIVGEAQAVFGEDNTILEIKGYWEGRSLYPKVGVLFATDDALQEAKEKGLFDQVAIRIGEDVRHDPAFGRRGASFDENLAVWGTSDSIYWEDEVLEHSVKVN